jgi:hypothetical protein
VLLDARTLSADFPYSTKETDDSDKFSAEFNRTGLATIAAPEPVAEW